jgi:hypothetical protein
MEKAIKLHLRGLAQDKLPLPRPSTFAEYVDVAV